jgi:hypothetical protein
MFELVTRDGQQSLMQTSDSSETTHREPTFKREVEAAQTVTGQRVRPTLDINIRYVSRESNWSTTKITTNKAAGPT